MWMNYFSTFWKCQVVGHRGAGWILVSDLCSVGSFVGPKRQIKTNQKKALLDFELEGWAPNSKWLSPCRTSLPSGGFLVLAVVLGREIFEGGKAIAAGHVLLEFFLESFETDAVLLVGPELCDVEAGGMRHVDHVGIGQHGEFIFLEEDKSSLSTCKNPWYWTMNPSRWSNDLA